METTRSLKIRDKIADLMHKGQFPKMVIFTSDMNQTLEERFKEEKLQKEEHTDSYMVKAGIFRAALSTGYAGAI